jgi:hypothetical protein
MADDVETPLGIVAAAGWRRAFMVIDWARWSVAVDWIPLAAFSIHPNWHDDFSGEPVMPRGAPSVTSGNMRWGPLMDPQGVILFEGRTYLSTAEWFAAWCEGKGDYSISSESGLPRLDPSKFRPQSEPTTAKRAAQPLRAVR